MSGRQVVHEIRDIYEYMRSNRRYSSDNIVNYSELDTHIEALIGVIDKIDKENYRLQPTILEQSIMDFINSDKNGRASLEAIVNACCTSHDDFLTISFVTKTIDQLRSDNKIELMWFRSDGVYTYRVLPES